MAYNGYNESRKKSTLKYMKEKMKTINLRIPRERYEKEIEPYINMSGQKMTPFIKSAIYEKISRDFGVNFSNED